MSLKAMARMLLKKVNRKKEFLYRQSIYHILSKECYGTLYKVDIDHILSKECYAALYFNHIMTLYVVPGIQICQCH